MPMPADYLPIKVDRTTLFREEGECEDCHFYFSLSALTKIKKDGPRWKYRKYELVPRVLESPLIVFENLKREEFEDGLAYVGKPCDDGLANPATMGYLFLVFVRKEFGLVVFEWDWRQESSQPGYPENWGVDFGRVAWQKT